MVAELIDGFAPASNYSGVCVREVRVSSVNNVVDSFMALQHTNNQNYIQLMVRCNYRPDFSLPNT